MGTNGPPLFENTPTGGVSLGAAAYRNWQVAAEASLGRPPLASLARWPLEAAGRRLEDPWVLEELIDVGVLAVEFPPHPRAALGSAARYALRHCACVTVALADKDCPAAAYDDFDVVLGVDAVDAALVGSSGSTDDLLANVVDRVLTARAASHMLAEVLRLGRSLQPLDRLTLESMSYSLLMGSPDFAKWLDTRKAYAPRPPTGNAVLADRRSGSLRLTLNRPAVHNAYNSEMRDRLVEGLRLARVDPSIERVVIEGAGRSFCSGGDLDEFGTAQDVRYAHAVRTTRSAAAELFLLRERAEAHVHGACIGAGVELSSFCHRVVADPDTRFRLPEVHMGLIPGAGGTVSLPARLGRQRTMLFALMGQTLDATTALRIGLVDAIDRFDSTQNPP